MGRFATGARRSGWIGRLRRRWPPWYILLAVLGFLSLVIVASNRQSPYSGVFTAQARIDALYARQSSTLTQAMSRYSLRNNRAPPPMYSEWYKFARAHSCLIDEYDQISRDFEPFYQLAQDDPAYFKKMVEAGSVKVKKDGNGMKTGVFAGGKFSFTDEQGTLYTSDWPQTFARFESFMPNMSLILNGRDEPRVIFNYRQPDMRLKALNVSDPTPFELSPHPTAAFYKEIQCLIPNRASGFTELANDASAFMLYSSSTQFTTDLYPILSMTKISPCFADILVPSEFYYSDSYWVPRYAYPNNITWTDKTPKLYWRGMSSGGWVYDDNYHAFPRFRVVDIGRNHTDLMDVALSSFHDSLCGEHCDGDAVKAEYNIYGASAPREEVYKYKYSLTSTATRSRGATLASCAAARSSSSTVFAEYFNDWLRPYEHYIPVLPDLSDLVEKLEWATTHDAEAHAIQQAGQAFSERVLTDAQNDCYFSAVFLEWARLQAMADEAL
ncbi:glycosyl transferase family 90-domain-containing protein [Mycena rosella]|uniref:Glycosyl transferase family 90-domain-containing protein n=1 Tax=Mycena rosella TaxID=1033263 RepID=A0AAD7CVC5_MYCRO|nr:glycosyl transferase family 90-domain-containing protein [Mycena rosella]